MTTSREQWDSDVWVSASNFLLEFTDIMEDLRYKNLPVVSRSGRFQDPALRQFQALVHQVDLALTEQNPEYFLSASSDLLDFSDSIEIRTDEPREFLERIEDLFSAVETEILYRYTSDAEQKNSTIPPQPSLIEVLKLNPELIYGVDPRVFEELIAEVFHKNGFEVELTAATRDGGKDIIAIKRDMGIPVKYLIECKRYKRDRKVSIDIVQRLYGVTYSSRANMGLVVTTSSFTKDAEIFASQHPWELALRDYTHLIEWLSKIPK